MRKPLKKTEAGEAAEKRKMTFVRLDVTPHGGEVIVWSTPCVSCGAPFEALTPRAFYIGVLEDLPYRGVNWRCVECRDPELVAVSKERARLRRIALDVADLL